MTGPQGELGARGPPGKQGPMGFQGEQGQPGIAGKSGVPVSRFLQICTILCKASGSILNVDVV